MELENVAEIEVEIQESGPAGEQGPPGLSAYEVYLVNGGTLSETEWLESLKGETGSEGAAGKDGVDGKDGVNGVDGKDGYTPVKGVDYFTEEDIASLNIPTKTSQLENDSDFVDSKYVDDAIANIDTSGSDVDLTNYYTKDEIEVLIDQNEPGCKIYIAKDVYSRTTASPDSIYSTSQAGKNILAAVQKAYDNGDYKFRLRMCASDPALYPQYIDTVLTLPESGTGSITETTIRTYSLSNVTTTTLKYYYFIKNMSMSNGVVTSPTNVGSINYKEDTMINSTKLKSYLEDYSTTDEISDYIDTELSLEVYDVEIHFSSNSIGNISNSTGKANLSALVNHAYQSKRPLAVNIVYSNDYTKQADELFSVVNQQNAYFLTDSSMTNTYIRIYGAWTDGVFAASQVSRQYASNENYLSKHNTSSYTPTADYHPATKQYTDYMVSTKGDTPVYSFNWNTYKTEEALNIFTKILNDYIASEHTKSAIVIIGQISTEASYYDDSPEIYYRIYKSNSTSYGIEGVSFRSEWAIRKYFPQMNICTLNLTVTDNGDNTVTVTRATISRPYTYEFLPITNSISFTPTGNYNPATKKYVDDKTKDITVQMSTLPTASSSNLGKIYQYIGDTNETYTKGYFYEVISETVTETADDGTQTETTVYGYKVKNVQTPGFTWDFKSTDDAAVAMFKEWWQTYLNTGILHPMTRSEGPNDGLVYLPYIEYRLGSSKYVTVTFVYLKGNNTVYMTAPSIGYFNVELNFDDTIDNRGSVTSIALGATWANKPLVAYDPKGTYAQQKQESSALVLNNTVEYTPSGDYNPATKKYVDDAIAAAIASLGGGTE